MPRMNYRELEDLYDRFGGKFAFTVMLQKRVRMLVRADKPLLRVESDNPIDIAVAEARAGKIWLDEATQEIVTEDTEASEVPVADADTSSSSDGEEAKTDA